MPVAVAVGAGAVWVADAGRGTLLEIDPATRKRRGAPIRVGGAPFAVAVADGVVWVADQTGEVLAIDPRTRARVGSPVRVPGANGLAVGLGGVWVTSRRAGTLTRVDPGSHRADRPIRVGEAPGDVVVADGAVWVANATGASVSRLVPGAPRADRPIPVGGEVLALAAGDGGVWVGRTAGEFAQQVSVVRLDTHTRRLRGRPVPVPGAIPLDLATGRGTVWATDVGGLRPPGRPRPGSVTRITTSGAPRVTATLRTGDRPTAVAVGGRTTWVANAADGTVTPVATDR